MAISHVAESEKLWTTFLSQTVWVYVQPLLRKATEFSRIAQYNRH